MKILALTIVLALCAGCAHLSSPFIQDGIRIVPPIKTNHGENEFQIPSTIMEFNDGGTKCIKIEDAKGKIFDVYIDHRIDTKTPGAIYLNNYPGKSNSVLVVNPKEFKQKIGALDVEK